MPKFTCLVKLMVESENTATAKQDIKTYCRIKTQDETLTVNSTKLECFELVEDSLTH